MDRRADQPKRAKRRRTIPPRSPRSRRDSAVGSLAGGGESESLPNVADAERREAAATRGWERFSRTIAPCSTRPETRLRCTRTTFR